MKANVANLFEMTIILYFLAFSGEFSWIARLDMPYLLETFGWGQILVAVHQKSFCRWLVLVYLSPYPQYLSLSVKQ